MSYFRLNNKAATTVEKGIAVALLSNLEAGAKIMKAGGIRVEIALRVLLHPSQRRENDWHRESTPATNHPQF